MSQVTKKNKEANLPCESIQVRLAVCGPIGHVAALLTKLLLECLARVPRNRQEWTWPRREMKNL